MSSLFNPKSTRQIDQTIGATNQQNVVIKALGTIIQGEKCRHETHNDWRVKIHQNWVHLGLQKILLVKFSTKTCMILKFQFSEAGKNVDIHERERKHLLQRKIYHYGSSHMHWKWQNEKRKNSLLSKGISEITSLLSIYLCNQKQHFQF